MDYEKKYKEALERARDYKNNIVHKELTVGESIMDYIFPELKESEDERIRKEIIDVIQHTFSEISRGKKKWIAWLENIPYTIDREKREGFHLGYKAALEKQDEKSSTVDIESMIEAYEQRLINQGNGVRNSPIVNMCVAAFKHGVENTLDELHLKQGETSPILSNSSNIGKDEQKPWSEKDEKEYKYVLKFVDNILNNCGNKKDYEHCKRCYDWLKSIKQKIGG